MVDVATVLASQKDYLMHEAERIGEQLAQLGVEARALRRLEALPAFEDIASVNLSWDYGKSRPEIAVRLDKEHKDSPLLRQIVGEFGGTIKKSIHYDGESLDAKGEIEGLTLSISSYLPSTCRIETESYLIPATDAHYGTRNRIVCDPPEPTTEPFPAPGEQPAEVV